MKTLLIPNGILHLAESKAFCPHCERKIPFDEIEDKWMKQNNHFMRMKCKCKKFTGIAMEITFCGLAVVLMPPNRCYTLARLIKR